MWCALFMVIAEFAAVVMRYGFGVGSIALQEAVLYAQSALFLLGAAWTLQIGGHVRIDVFYAKAPPRRRAMVDLFGALVFLLPFAIALAILSIPYAARSWSVLEHSREASGLPFVYLLKSLIPLFAAPDRSPGRVAGTPRHVGSDRVGTRLSRSRGGEERR